MPPIIQIDNLHKYYAAGETSVHALRGISLVIERGEFVAVMGASGSGKSTLMNMLGCLDRPGSGRYELDGADVGALDTDQLADVRNQKIGFVFQGYNLLARTTALENVELPMLCGRRKLTAPQVRQRAEHSLFRVGLAQRANHFPNQLSAGQQQRVAIARALINEPEVILADEPTGNLDSKTSVDIMEIFQKLNDEGITVILVTHEPDIARYSKRILIILDGQLVRDEPVRERLEAARERGLLARDGALERVNR